MELRLRDVAVNVCLCSHYTHIYSHKQQIIFVRYVNLFTSIKVITSHTAKPTF